MSKTGARRSGNPAKRAQEATLKKRERAREVTSSSSYPITRALTKSEFEELDDRVQRERLNGDDLWQYAAALAPIDLDTSKAYRSLGLDDNTLLANRTIGIDFYYHLKLVRRHQFEVIAVEGNAHNYTVSLLQLRDRPTNGEDKRPILFVWLDLTSEQAGAPIDVGHFWGWLNAAAYSHYRAFGRFEDINAS